MEVLEKAKAKTVWTTNVECKGVTDVRQGCGAKLSITEDDLFRVLVGRTGCEHFVAQFQCPECFARTDYDDYPEPAVLIDYWHHPSYRSENELTGYTVERNTERNIWALQKMARKQQKR